MSTPFNCYTYFCPAASTSTVGRRGPELLTRTAWTIPPDVQAVGRRGQMLGSRESTQSWPGAGMGA